MGRFIYLIKWIISRAQDPHSGWSRRGTAQGGEGVWWVGFLTISKYFIKYISKKYTYEKGEHLKVRSTEEYWCQFGFIHWPFFRGRRQGRQPLNPAMPRRVVWEAKHSFSYPGARPCRRPSPKILQPAGVFTFLGVRGGKKEGKIWRCVLEVLVGRFLVDFWSFFLFFWYCPRVKIV